MTSRARLKAASAIHEFDLIRTLQQRYGSGGASVLRGIGDDAAVMAPAKKHWQLLTTDLLTEGVHFDLRTAPYFDIGFRAAAANLSDIAAMGGIPRYLLVCVAIPRTGTNRHVHQLYEGMMAACRPHKVRLIGGDTSESDAAWFISSMWVGSVKPGRALYRSGARAGGDLYGTGPLGGAVAGL
jgi:thiamine-monophosphate kinase